MTTAGERYEERTGNIWSYSNRGDLTGIRAALTRGVDVNIINTVGWTPCHAAAAGGQNKALRLLIKAGADLSIADKGGNLPVHQAAKNGHVHALKVLQDLGADVSKVRLSQVKGKAARTLVLDAYRKSGRSEDEEDGEEKDIAVGYSRRQAKSTAFWGPRRTPISGKIKKKILKDKRKTRKVKKETKRDEKNFSKLDVDAVVAGPDDTQTPCEENNEPSYLDTVRQVKRTKKQRRREKEGRKAQSQLKERQDQYSINEETFSSNSGDEDSLAERSEDSVEDNDTTEYTAGYFSALALLSDDSDCD